MEAKLFWILLVVVFLLMAQDFCLAQGQIDFNFIGAGARARGMGGAFIGGADDATAASWNPAGLVYLEKPEASAVYVYSSVFQTIDDEAVEDLGLSHGYINFVSAALPLSIGDRNVVGCIAYQRVIDLFNKQDVTLSNGTYETNQKGGVDAVSPSLGIQVSPQLSLGLALNIYIGGTTTKWTSWDTDREIEAPKETYSGSNMSLGGILDLGMYRVGAVYKTPYTLKAERDQRLGVGDLIDFYDYEFEMKMPGMLGIGVMVEPTSNLRLAADYELRSFSNFESRFKGNDFEKPDPEFLDVNQFRLGAEYLLMFGNKIIPLRLGLKTEPKQYKDANDDQVMGAALTMGLGLVSQNFSLSAALEFSATTLKLIDPVYFYESEVTTSQLNLMVSGIFYFGN
ncbi:MAG: hypothetical protein JSW07_16655 [bacterium]|nr:MAG: hypothetical protein JSW07_16655 [bacterium]